MNNCFFKKKKNLFSAVQPSGNLTIGNYFSVLKYWKILQNEYNCMFCIANLHSLTNVLKDKEYLTKNSILDTLSLYLACGVNPKKSVIFLQSNVSAHSQLNWILNCYVYYQELKRMTQFKDKYKNFKNRKINSGIFNYPTLMASDILLYETDFVNVGKDQVQHIELSKIIANRFNKIHKNIFKIPKFLIYNNGIKIMSLLKPRIKMSKSDINKKNVIFLLDNINLVLDKIKNAVTDSDVPPKIVFDPIKKPGISNLLIILSSVSNLSISKIEKKFFNNTYKNFKDFLCYKLCFFLKKLQKRYMVFRSDEKKLNLILEEGSYKATIRSKKIINKVFKVLSL